MEPFLHPDQYHFMRQQAKQLAAAHSSINDFSVIDALKEVTVEKAMALSPAFSTEQQAILHKVADVQDKEQAELFAAALKAYIQPFPVLTEAVLKKLFPKVKKWKVPVFEEEVLQESSYVRWHDAAAMKTYLVMHQNGRFTGIRGTLQSDSMKNVCTICNGHEHVALFMSESKKTAHGTTVKRGNYICTDSRVCNENIQSTDKLKEFMERLSR